MACPDEPGSRFPDLVPVLVDPAHGLTLRAHQEADLPAMVEQCRDPDTIRWTTVPTTYGPEDAREFLAQVIAAGWDDGREFNWALEAERDGARRYCGTVALRPEPGEAMEVAFALHPGARGRGLMSTAVRLVGSYAFTVRSVRALRWRALVGNWSSRRVAAAAGYRFDGTVRALLPHRGELLDGWHATLLPGDEEQDQRWSDPPPLSGTGVDLRPFSSDDAARVAEACSDPLTRHWLASLPDPYGLSDAQAYLELTREDSARRSATTWCVADPTDDRCLGAIGLEGLGSYHRRTEIGYWTHPAERRRGVMTEAVRLVTAYAESELRVDSIQIRCAEGNRASRHVAEAAGYRLVGVLLGAEPLGDGTLSDLVVYARP